MFFLIIIIVSVYSLQIFTLFILTLLSPTLSFKNKIAVIILSHFSLYYTPSPLICQSHFFIYYTCLIYIVLLPHFRQYRTIATTSSHHKKAAPHSAAFITSVYRLSYSNFLISCFFKQFSISFLFILQNFYLKVAISLFKCILTNLLKFC